MYGRRLMSLLLIRTNIINAKATLSVCYLFTLQPLGEIWFRGTKFHRVVRRPILMKFGASVQNKK